MSLFEFVTVIISMVLALALGHLLLGVAGLAKNQDRVTGYLAHSMWLVGLFLLVLGHWWSQWDFRGLEWTYPSFFYVTLGPTLLFFAVALLVPVRAGEGPGDMKVYFLSVRPLFMTVMLAYSFVTWFDGPILQGQPILGPLGIIHIVFTGGLLVGLSSANARVQNIVALAMAGLVFAVMAVRFFPGAFG